MTPQMCSTDTPKATAVVVVGVDPSMGNTGVVGLLLPVGYEDVLRSFLMDADREAALLAMARWHFAADVSPTSSKKLSAAEREVSLADRLQAALAPYAGTIGEAVLERPAEANRGRRWAGQGQGKVEKRGTGFATGAAYGMALASCALYAAKLHSYAPTTTKKGQGWMPRVRTGNLVHAQKRDRTVAQLRDLAYRVMARGHTVGDPARLSDDQLMALGVLWYHLLRYYAPASTAGRSTAAATPEAPRGRSRARGRAAPRRRPARAGAARRAAAERRRGRG